MVPPVIDGFSAEETRTFFGYFGIYFNGNLPGAHCERCTVYWTDPYYVFRDVDEYTVMMTRRKYLPPQKMYWMSSYYLLASVDCVGRKRIPLAAIEEIRDKYSGIRFVLFMTADQTYTGDMRYVEIVRNASDADKFHTLAFSDVLVMSITPLSYMAGMSNQNVVYYTPTPKLPKRQVFTLVPKSDFEDDTN
jgi:hypothetical protein